MKKEKIIALLLELFTFLFLIFPSSYGIIDLKIVIILFPILLVILKLFKKVEIKEKYHIWIILALAVVTRIGIVLLLNSSVIQVSDFANSLNASYSLDFSTDYYRVFTHWILYPTITNFIYKIFGASQLVALLLNSSILVFTSLFIYKVCSLLYENKNLAFITTIIYILWPANILYTIIYTQEHLCILSLMIVLFLFLKNEQNEKFDYKKIINLIILGILLGFSTFLKNFAPVFIIAFIIYYVLKSFNAVNLKKYTFFKMLTIFIIFISYSFSKAVIFNYIDNLVGQDVARNIIPCYLNVGLRDTGTYSDKNYNTYFSTLKVNNYNFDKTNDIVMKALINDSKYNLSINFFSNKADILFGGDFARISWVLNTLNFNFNSVYVLILNGINLCFFTILVVLMIIGLIPMNKDKNLKIFLMYLIFFGSFLLLLLVEAQNRYMYAIQFIMCILSAGGIDYLNKKYIKRSK